MNAKLCQLVQLIGTLLLAMGVAYAAAEMFKHGIYHSQEDGFLITSRPPMLPMMLAASGGLLWLVASRRIKRPL